MPRQLDPGQRAFALAPLSLPELPRRRVPGGRRFDHLEDGGGFRELRLFDTELDVECVTSGRCTPAAAVIASGFADASCTESIRYTRLTCFGDVRYATDDGISYREIGPPRLVFLPRDDGTCIPLSDTYEVGPVISSERFAPATRVVD
jgi:hypothetical protein